MTNDQFKLLVYATALLGIVFIEKNGTFRQDSSSSAWSSPVTPYAWWQESNQHIKPQDSPWLWLYARPHTRQVVQKNQNEKEEISVSQQPAQLQPVREEDRVYNETSPVERIEMMEKLRRFRLEQQGEQVTPVRL